MAKPNIATAGTAAGKVTGQMPRIIFFKPNEPEQPAKGVYRWYCQSRKGEVTIYVGRTRARGCTLIRGVEHICDHYPFAHGSNRLENDFIVGSAIRYVSDIRKLDCYWQHENDDPEKEVDCCKKFSPLLQDGAGIKKQFRDCMLGGKEGTKKERIDGAEEQLFREFDKAWRNIRWQPRGHSRG